MKNLLNIISHKGFNRNTLQGSVALLVIMPIALYADTTAQTMGEYRHQIAGFMVVCMAIILLASWACRNR